MADPFFHVRTIHLSSSSSSSSSSNSKKKLYSIYIEYLRSKMGKNFFDLYFGGIHGPQKRKSKYYNTDKTNSRFVINMPENPLVPILMSCVEILTKP